MSVVLLPKVWGGGETFPKKSIRLVSIPSFFERQFWCGLSRRWLAIYLANNITGRSHLMRQPVGETKRHAACYNLEPFSIIPGNTVSYPKWFNRYEGWPELTLISFATNVFPDPGRPLRIMRMRLGLFCRPGWHSKSSINTVSALDEESVKTDIKTSLSKIYDHQATRRHQKSNWAGSIGDYLIGKEPFTRSLNILTQIRQKTYECLE